MQIGQMLNICERKLIELKKIISIVSVAPELLVGYPVWVIKQSMCNASKVMDMLIVFE